MSSRKQRVIIFTLILMVVASAASVFAQERVPQPPPPPGPEGGVMIFQRHIEPPPGGEDGIRMMSGGGPENTFIFIGTEMSFGRKVVKNAPYSAQAVTETVQTLSDGNRIVHKNTASIYRDSEGRIRHDQTLGSIGPWAAAGESQQTTFINDPVTRTHYMLDPRSRIARKMTLPEPPEKPAPPPAAPGRPSAPPAQREDKSGDVFTVRIAPPADMGGGGTRIMKSMDKPKTESLGKQTIEGVEAEGTRDTITIPAGEIGNEQPIQIVSERWYSPELQTVVLSKHTDPRMGETTFRLTNISRNEPARTLFEVPSDYTIKDGPAQIRTFRRKSGDEK